MAMSGALFCNLDVEEANVDLALRGTGGLYR
jgi:hypothetical protein